MAELQAVQQRLQQVDRQLAAIEAQVVEGRPRAFAWRLQLICLRAPLRMLVPYEDIYARAALPGRPPHTAARRPPRKALDRRSGRAAASLRVLRPPRLPRLLRRFGVWCGGRARAAGGRRRMISVIRFTSDNKMTHDGGRAPRQPPRALHHVSSYCRW